MLSGVQLGAAIAGNVADANFDTFGDNANSLPGAAPVLISAGVLQTGGPGSNGTTRTHMEWALGSLSSPVESARVLLNTNKGTVDSLDTFFFYATADGNGTLEDSDFEMPATQISGAVMPVPSVPNGTDGSFTLDVTAALQSAIASDFDYFVLQGRVGDESSLTAARGLQIRSTAAGNLTSNLEPQLLVNFPDLAVSVVESNDPVVAGSSSENLTYVVTVTNQGSSDATGVSISEDLTLAPGVTVDSVTPDTGSFVDTTAPDGTWTIGNLASGETATLVIVLTVDGSTANGTDVISNAATATLNETDANPADNSATESTSVVHTVDLAVSMTESVDPVVVGFSSSNLTYVVTVANVGTIDVTGVALSEDLSLPAGVTVVSVTPSAGSFTNTTAPDGTWTISSLTSGTTETLTIVLAVSPATAAGTDVIGNSAALTSLDQSDTNITNDSATQSTSVTHATDLAVQVTESIDPVVAGSGAGNLTYVVTVSNIGDFGATGVELQNLLTLPDAVTVVSVTPSAGTTFNDPIWSVGSLPSDTSAVLTIVLTVAAAAAPGTDVIRNSASLIAVNESDVSSGNNSDIAVTSIIQGVDLAVSVSELADPVVAGSGTENLTYVVTVANVGTTNATGVILSEDLTLPSGVTLVSVMPSAGSFSVTTAPDGTWNVGNLASGANATLTVVLTVDGSTAPDPDVISNTASLFAVSPADTNSANDSFTQTTSVSPFGSFININISGRAYQDHNANGTFDGTDSGQPGVAVTLYFDGNDNGVLDDIDSDTVVDVQYPDAGTGAYSFRDYGPGRYFVIQSAPGFVQTLPAAMSYTLVASSGVNVTDRDFGNFQANVGGPYAVNQNGLVQLHAFYSTTALSAGIDATQTSLTVANASVLPPADTSPSTIDFYIKVDTELMAVKDVVGNTLTVVRGSTAHAAGAAVLPQPVANLSFAWDLDGDDLFGETGVNALRGDEVGAHPTFDATGLPVPSSKPIALRVTNGNFPQSSADADAGSDVVNVVNIINEGESTTLAGALTTGSTTVRLNWDDGFSDTLNVTGQTSFSKSHTYADNGQYTITQTIVDNFGSRTTQQFQVVVNNVAPTLAAVPNISTDEGTFISLPPATFSDPGFDNPLNTNPANGGEVAESFTATIDWGDGTTEPVGDIILTEDDGEPGVATTGMIQATHAYADNGVYTATVTVFDDDGGSDVQTFQVTVANVNPTITSFTNTSAGCGGVLEGNPMSVTASFSDPGFDNSLNTGGEVEETFTAIINWDDGTTSPPLPVTVTRTSGSEGVLSLGTVTASHTYLNGGIYRIEIKVFDDDGGVNAAATTTVIAGAGVNNNVLQIIGTNNADHVTVNKQGNGLFKVHADFFENVNFKTFPTAGVELINVVLCGGDDHLNIAGNISTRAIIDGGPGNDNLPNNNNSSNRYIVDDGGLPYPPASGDELGAVINTTIPAIDLSGVDRSFGFEATHTGTLTLQSLFSGAGTAQLVLLDASGNVLANSVPISGGARIDFDSTAGEQHFAVAGEHFTVLVLGTNSNVSLQIQNMLTVNSPLTVHGSDGADTYEFTAGGDIVELKVNGVRYVYDAAQIGPVTFLGNDANDALTLYVPSADDVAALTDDTADVLGENYAAFARNIGQIDIQVAEWWAVFQNTDEAADVDGDGSVAPIDVLLVINILNEFGSQSVLAMLSQGNVSAGSAYLDVNADNFITPIDVLWVINALSAQPIFTGEGEGGGEFLIAVSNGGASDESTVMPVVYDAGVIAAALGAGTIPSATSSAAPRPLALLHRATDSAHAAFFATLATRPAELQTDEPSADASGTSSSLDDDLISELASDLAALSD